MDMVPYPYESSPPNNNIPNFLNPVQSGIPRRDVESMLKALGAKITKGNGSRVRVSLNGVRAVFPRPHPRKETDKGAIIFLRQFLTEAKVKDAKT